ncbi:MAG: hypothetical protein WAM70_19155, partial [Pyrinomonadaceae bacterium]
HSQIDPPLITQVLGQNPELDLSRPLPSSLHLNGMSVEHQEQARQSLDLLRREINMFPEFDYKATLASKSGPAIIDNPIRKGVAQFLANDPDFELANTHIDAYLAAHPTALDGIAEEQRAPVTRQLKAMQRISRIAHKYEHLEALMGEGLHSAHKIAAIPKRNFVKQFREAFGGEKQAKQYHNKAAQYSATAVTVAAGLNDALNGITPGAMDDGKNVEALIKKMPSLAGLFGSFDLCECQHCRSVYGPAAYFVDLLQFVNPDVGEKPLDVLLQRRPDLAHIKLSCENTNTPLPYVDLVNEILEFYVEHKGIKPGDGKELAKDTDLSAAELSTNPQYTSDGAYAKLRDAVHSFHLPFNLPVETARIYLEHLGSSRHELMKVIQNAGDPENKQPSDFELACEYLKITPEEATIITGAAFNPPKLAREFFGYSTDSVVHFELDDQGKKVPKTEDWLENLVRVPEFLQRTGISYLELIELTKTFFINPGQGQAQLPSDLIVLFSPDSVCDLSKTSIRHLGGEPLTDEELLKMHRFLRLWRKLGWTMPELDKALKGMQASTIDVNVLQELFYVEKVRAELGLPIVALLSLWFPIDMWGEDSLYNKLFLNKAVLNPVDPAFELSDAPGNDPLISDHVPAILAALAINAEDLAAIRASTNLSGQNAPLNPINLTVLFRHALLAKGLKLKVKELLALKELSDPFGGPAKPWEFVEKVRKIKSSGQTIAQLAYIYRDTSEPGKSLAPTDDEIALLTTQLQDGLKKIADDNQPATDPGGELTRKNLELIWDGLMVEQMIGLIDGSAIYSAPLIELPPDLMLPSSVDTGVPFAYDEPDQMLVFDGQMTEVERSLLLGFSGDPDYQAAVDLLFTSGKANKKNTVPVKPLQGKMGFFAAGTGRITYDDAANVLQFAGPMSLKEKMILLSLATKPSYHEVIDELFQEPRNFLLDPKAEFLGLDPMTEVEWLLDQEATTAEERFGFVLARLLAYLLGRSFVKQTLSDALELEPAVTTLLLETLVQSSNDPLAPVIDDFMALLKPDAIDTFRKSFQLLNRIALLINGFKMTAAEVAYLSTHGSDFAVFDPTTNEDVDFDFNALSDSNAPSSTVLFRQWERLYDLFSLRDRLPKGDVTLIDLFAASAASLDQSKLSNVVT